MGRPLGASTAAITEDSALGGTDIQRSLRIRRNNSSYLARTPSSASNRRTWTWSAWVRRQKLGTGYMFMYSDASANSEVIQFDSSNRLHYYVLASGSYQINYISNRTFEDTSKFYHFMVAVDTTQSTNTNKIKMYVPIKSFNFNPLIIHINNV